MKSIPNLLAASLLAAVLGTVPASAADDAAAAPAANAGLSQGWHHHGARWHMLGNLGLSDAQKQQVKDILAAAHPPMQSLQEQMRTNTQLLQHTQPSDPNYANIASQVSQTHGSLSAQMMTQRAEVRAQVFKVLTPAQQAQLAALEEAESRGANAGRR